jgi:hypothetical protein
MNPDCISRNLAAVESHFHSEAQNEVETALEAYTEDIVWDAPALNGIKPLLFRQASSGGKLPETVRLDA